eukprot:1727923-Karenia_brevis.AAC.1
MGYPGQKGQEQNAMWYSPQQQWSSGGYKGGKGGGKWQRPRSAPYQQATPFSSMLRGMHNFMGEVTSFGEIVNFANKLQGANQSTNPNPGQHPNGISISGQAPTLGADVATQGGLDGGKSNDKT